MIDDPQSPPPDPHAPKNLGRLFKQLPSIVHQHQEKNGRLPKASKKDGEAQPNKFCKVCRVVWHEDAIFASKELSPKICQSCAKELAEGGRAVVAPSGEFLFCWGAGVVDLPQINEVSQGEYDAIGEYAKKHPKPE